MRFTVVVAAQPEGGYLGQCLEFPGAAQPGQTQEEAAANVEQALARMLEYSDL